MNFKLKYLKYKKKYLELKNQSGGNYDCKKDLYNLQRNDICEEKEGGEFFDMNSCINSERCNNKWENANSYINIITKQSFLKFDTFLDALNFKNSSKDSKDNLDNISVSELKISNMNEYMALNNFNTIYAEDVSLGSWHFNNNIENINLPNFFNKIKNILKLNLNIRSLPIGLGVLPQSLTHLTLNVDYPPIEVGVLPQSLTHLTFGNNFNSPIEVGGLPQSLTHLEFGNSFNSPIEVGVLPQSLTHLDFGNPIDIYVNSYDCCNYDTDEEHNGNHNYSDNFLLMLNDEEHNSFNQEIGENVLPTSLTHLYFSYHFNKPLGNSLNNLVNLTHLMFGCKFNQPIELGRLPPNLIHLMFDTYFNQKIEANVLPQSLTNLIFTPSSKFNKPIELNVLPSNLTHLVFGYKFVRKIKENVLPQSLNYLIFRCSSMYNHELDLTILPNNLTYLCLGRYFYEPIVLPQSLTHLDIYNKEHDQINLLNNKLRFEIMFNQFDYLWS